MPPCRSGKKFDKMTGHDTEASRYSTMTGGGREHMDQYRYLSDKEIESYIVILEQEIGLCQTCDLPISHLEAQVEVLRDVLRLRTVSLMEEYFKFHGVII